MHPLGEVAFAGRVGDALHFDGAFGWQVRVFVLGDDLVRVLLVRNGILNEPRTWAIAPGGVDVRWEGRDRFDATGFSPPLFSVEQREGEVKVATATLSVAVRLKPFGLRWSALGNGVAADRDTSAYLWSERDNTLRHYMERVATDRYFGLGDKTGPLDKHGRRLRSVAMDALGYDAETSDPLYKHWPFVLVRDGRSGISYGLYYDTLASTTFDLGCEHDNYHGFYRYAEIARGDLDYYLFVGPGIRDVVRKFAELTGRMAFGPRWSLGYANTAMSLTDAPDAQRRLAQFANALVEHDIPLSAFHFGSGYTSIGKRRYVFTWNRDKFPDPQVAVAAFKERNARVVVNLKPCLLDDHPAYEEVVERGAFVRDAETGAPCVSQFWDGQGAHIDFTNPEGVRWWQDHLRREVLEYGIDAGWNDNNEYEIWDEHGVSDGFGRPLSIDCSRPLQALLMTRATAEAQAGYRPDERVYTVTRAGPPGIQRYAQTWSGDNATSWHTLRWNIRMGLSMSLSGLFNVGHDIGGFSGPVPDPELLVRWVQSGAFSPRFIMNSWKEGGETNTPWLHPDVTPLIREAIRLRYRLMPYLYTIFRAAAERGEPILRPLFHEFEDDPRTFDDSDDFMLGPSLLVASVVEPGAQLRRVYLPRGASGWYDFHTHAHHEAGREATVETSLERIPLFVPAGAMIPLTDSDDFRRLHDEPSRRLVVFPPLAASASRFVLYEDDGLSLDYRRGELAEVTFELRTTREEIVLSASVAGRFELPYRQVAVQLPAAERRPLVLRSAGVELLSPSAR